MSDVNSLSIQIKADASKASKNLDKLTASVKGLSGAMSGTNIKRIDTFANSLSKLASTSKSLNGIKNYANAMASLAKATKDIDNNKLEVMSNSLNKLGRSLSGLNLEKAGSFTNAVARLAKTSKDINPTKLGNVSNSINKLGNNLSGLDLAKTKNFINAISRLPNATKNINNAKLDNMSESITRLGSNLSDLDLSKAKNFTSAVARLANAGDKTSATANGLPLLQKNLKSFVRALSGANVLPKETNEIVSSISRLANAGAKASTTANALDSLGDKTLAYITKISKAPQVNENTVRLVSALGQLANAGAKTNSVFNTLAGGTRRASSSMSGFGNTVRGAFSALIKFNSVALIPTRVNIFKLADTVASLTGKFWILTAITRKVGASIGSAMDYVETLNFFDNALDTLKSNANEDFKKLGYDTADEYVNSFRDRSETLLAKMSGFKINADSGMLEMTDMQNLGVDPNMLMNYQSIFTQMATSLGLAETNASKLGQVLPEIGADMASLYNKEFTDVWDDLQSGITGMARTWDKYGTNIRVANMEQYAATHGLDVNVKTMSQADKVLLRTIILLDSQRSAWTDLATTINQPRNQLRMLQANFTNLARTIGSIFLPIVAAVLPYLNAVMIVLNRAANAIANFVSALTGYKPKDLTGSIAVDSGVGDLAEDTDNYSNSAKKAAKATKEWKNQLMGFDEINKLEDSSDSGNGGGGSGSPSGAGGGGGLQGAFDSIYDEYQKAWDKAFNSMDNDAQRMAKKIQDAITKAWETSDGSGIGSAIAEWLNKGINAALGVVDKKTAVFKKFATVIATSINGFVDKLEWKNLGTLIGKNIKGDLEAIETFFDTVNWDNLGKGIATSLNAYFNSDTIEQKLKTIASVFKGAVELAFGAIEEFDFKSIGEHIGTGINDVLKKFGEVDPKTGLTTWQKLGKALSDGVSGLLDALITALDKVDWDKVGTAIGEFLEKVDWNKALLKVVKLIGKTFGALLETYIGSFKKSPVKMAILTAVGAVFTGVKISKVLKAFAKNEVAANLATYLGESFKNSTFLSKLKTGVSAFGTALKTTLTADIATTFTSGSCAAIAGTIATGIVGALIAAIGGWKLGKHIYNSLKKDENGDNIIDKFVTWCGDTMQKNATKFIAGGKVFMGNLAIGMLEKIPDWLQKLLGIDGKVAELKARIKAEQDQTIKDAENKLKQFEKPKTAKINAEANTKTANDELNKTAEKRTSTVTAKADTKTAKDDLNETANGKDNKGRTAKITAKLENKNGLSVDVKAKGDIDKKLKSWQKQLSTNKLKTYVKVEPDGTKVKFKLNVNQDKSSSNYGYTWISKAAQGGLFKNGKHLPITRYASGGIPNQGQMFIAREAGPEMVGKLGNATAVMNNDQIVASVAKGVQGAVEAGMRNVANMSSSNNPQYMQADIIIDGRKVMESVLAEARTVSLATNGTNVFMNI